MQWLKSLVLGTFMLPGRLLVSPPAALARQRDQPERPNLGLSDEQKEQANPRQPAEATGAPS